MAILWCRRKTGIGSGIGDRGDQSFVTEYTAKSDRPRENRSLVLASDLVPHYGAPHPENPAAVCVSVDAVQDRQNPFLWNITARWKVNPVSRRDPADQQKQPDLRREKWSLRAVPIPFHPFVDLAGQLLASSAGQPFDPAIEQPIICDEITVRRYEAECHRMTQRGFVDHVNTDPWCGAKAGEALVENITVEDEYLQGKYWFLTTYTILIKPKWTMELPRGTNVIIGGWDPVYIPDLGTLQWATVEGKTKLVPITRKDALTGKPFYDGRPAYLDGNGKELPRDASGVYLSDPVFREFHLKYRAAFAGLGLVVPSGLFFD